MIKIQTSEIVRDCPLSLSHLGILYVMDRKKTGRFYLEDVMSVVHLVYHRQEQARENHEQNNFQAYCSIMMWNGVRTVQGSQEFIEWMSRCFTEVEEPREFENYPGIKFIQTDSMKTLHEVNSSQR